MTTPGKLLDYFTLEGGEYAGRLDTLVQQRELTAADKATFVTAARGLRGSATMARASGISRLAATIERVAAGLAAGNIAWAPELQRAMIGAVEDVKVLVRAVRIWGPEQDERAASGIARLTGFAPDRDAPQRDVVIPISELFYSDNGPHILQVAATPNTRYEQQLREQGGMRPEETAAASERLKTPPRGRELRDVLGSSLARMRSLEGQGSGHATAPPAEPVPIQELLYRGRSAVERAAEIRRAIRKSGAAPTRALVDELLDLVELASAD